MSPDPNKKSPRTFQCRESLWQKFDQMAKELECSVDYLINDAMKQYARQRGYVGGTTRPSEASPSSTGLPAPRPPSSSPSGAHPQPGGSGAHPFPTETTGSGAHPQPGHPLVTAPPPPPGSVARGAPPPAPPAPGAKRVGPPPPPPSVLTGAAHVPPPPPPTAGKLAPPPPPAATHAIGSAAPAPAQQLFISYQGQPFAVTKDHFVIGRGKQSSDLTIKDPNVSRQHAIIEFVGGQYIIADMGSTNGIEYQGQRIQKKAIADGDVVKICDHELVFSFR